MFRNRSSNLLFVRLENQNIPEDIHNFRIQREFRYKGVDKMLNSMESVRNMPETRDEKMGENILGS